MKMSDPTDEVVRACENVFNGYYPKRYGLFPIPEYPEFNRAHKRGMWSTALGIILTTLRYIAPATILTLFWGHHSFFFRVLKQIDRSIRSIVFSSNEQKESVLGWLSDSGPVKIDQLNTVWRHGWILCGILDAALPGVCSGHQPIKLSLKHAQTLAQQYLGVEPVFSDQELNSDESLTNYQEWRLAHYLDKVRDAISRLPPPVSKPTSTSTSPDLPHYTLDYAARGMGLTVAQVNNKMHFNIYPSAQQSLEPADVTILIKGPKETYGMTVIPPILGRDQQIRKVLLNLQKDSQFTENKLPTTLGATYLRNYGRNDMNKTFHIPKSKYDIEITVESKQDHVKVEYVVNLEGKYEVSITSKGQNIVGSPFLLSASHNILGMLDRESFCLDDNEKVDIMDDKNDRKVVLRIVDFVTEKMVLREDGALEKISDEEATDLMATTNIDNKAVVIKVRKLRFKDMVIKVVLIIRICKIFSEGVSIKIKRQNTKVAANRNQYLGIPDIVNSTLSDRNGILNRTKKINLDKNKTSSIPSQVEKQKQFYESITKGVSQSTEKWFEIKDIEKDFSKTIIAASNPFIKSIEVLKENKDTADELCNIEQVEAGPITVLVDEVDTPESNSPNANPFIPPELLERPKTPVLKIITGNIQDREDSVFVDQKTKEIIEEIFDTNEFTNPFFVYHHRNSKDRVTDFKIGEPCSIPSIERANTTETVNDSFNISSKDSVNTNKKQAFIKMKEAQDSCDSVTFLSIDSNVSEDLGELDRKFYYNENNYQPARRDLWDSAYVSIDESNSSPDMHVDSPNVPEEAKLTAESYLNLGPAEKELWNSCAELSPSLPENNDDTRTSRWEHKRNVFTPIQEETDRSMSIGYNDISGVLMDLKESHNEIEPVMMALAEHEDVFLDNSIDSGQSSVNFEDRDKSIQSVEVNYSTKDYYNFIDDNNDDVDSASVTRSDVKRQTIAELEGTISEVQVNATESGSASQHLQVIKFNDKNNEKEHFENIVWEKKQFWDEKIKQIKEKEELEEKLSPKKNNLNKNLQTNSKQKEIPQTQPLIPGDLHTQKVLLPSDPMDNGHLIISNDLAPDEKLVDRWKKFWDEKLEVEQQEILNASLRSTPTKSKEASPVRTFDKTPLATFKRNGASNEFHSTYNKNVDSFEKRNPLRDNNTSMLISKKEEVPEEIMFQAFETSPKRFFGTSRKQILSKIDSYLGKQDNENLAGSSINKTGKENDLISCRVNLFQGITKDEKNIFKTCKSKSMSNIYHDPKVKYHKKTVQNEIKEKFGRFDSFTDVLTINKTKETNLNGIDKHVTSTTMPSCKIKLADTVKKIDRQDILINCDETDKKSKAIKLKIDNDCLNKRERFGNVQAMHKSSIWKSEMDIFTKIKDTPPENEFDKYKSCEELPKINVKSFITIYEQVSNSPEKQRFDQKTSISQINAVKEVSEGIDLTDPDQDNNVPSKSAVHEVINRLDSEKNQSQITPNVPPRKKRNIKTASEENHKEKENKELSRSDNLNNYKLKEKNEQTLNSLSAIKDTPEVEIIDNNTSIEECNLYQNVCDDYSLRFKSAKQFFQSIEDLSPKKKYRPKLNECEKLLYESNESQSEEIPDKQPQKRTNDVTKSVNSEQTKTIDQVQETKNEENNKMTKISEKFHVDDLFNDVVEGKLSRQGSLRGIPHKKAVLETFKSMENVSNKLSPYQLASQQTEMVESKVRNAQSFLTEYPYLPTTEPSKYHSRLDTKATGLLTMKELVQNKTRRYSVPDSIINPRPKVDT